MNVSVISFVGRANPLPLQPNQPCWGMQIQRGSRWFVSSMFNVFLPRESSADVHRVSIPCWKVWWNSCWGLWVLWSWSLDKCFWAELKSDFSLRFRLQLLLGKFQSQAQTSSIGPPPPLIPVHLSTSWVRRDTLIWISHSHFQKVLSQDIKSRRGTFFYYSATGHHWEKKSSGSNPGKALIRTVFVLGKECRDWREVLYLKLQ